MFTNKRFRKWIAVFLLLNITSYVLTPTLTYALTSGPTAPEANTFEPVDTTDMVNLVSGDFTYNVPLLEVPGPAGGYPISLSYHAGVLLNQDASWVGLGWNLNPGAITRTVSGYPDDFEHVIDNSRVFWEGQESSITNIGISLGIANIYSVSAGLSIGNDKYRGYGVGGYTGAGLNLPVAGSANLGVNATVGVSPWGDPYASVGLGVGIYKAASNGASLSASMGVNYNTSSGFGAGLSGGVSTFGNSLLDASINTAGTKPSLSVAGSNAYANNSKSSQVSSIVKNYSLDIPIYYALSVRIGHTYQRYWIDERLNLQTNGALYFQSHPLDPNALDNTAYDTYDLLDVSDEVSEEVEANNFATQVLGGSYPDYDQYFVAAQGVSGSMRPYHFRKELYRQNIKEGNEYFAKNYPFSETLSSPVEFRFINDFSNRLEYESGGFDHNGAAIDFNFDGDVVTGENGNEGYRDNHLVGSKHVEWFTNGEILGEEENKDPFTMGFLNTSSSGFVRESDTQIGGFMVTNESGITYHFSLPAYSYDEYSKSENKKEFKEKEGDTYNELKRPERYAYTWYLTAVTGPDYVDKNNNHFADDGDYGYWVSFDYGKWTEDYTWRNPGEGTHTDIDSDFENYSFGKKELYYLDAIRTASHTALFVKKMRDDGKGVVDGYEGGFDPRVNFNSECKVTLPVSVLGLDKVILVKNDQIKQKDFENLKRRGDKYDFYFDFECSYCASLDNYDGTDITCVDVTKTNYSKVNHFGDNVLDVSDFQSGANYEDESLRVIEFDTDYSLCKNTPNSLVNEKLYRSNPTAEKNGKLTLKGLNFLGKGGTSLLPPTTFNYLKNPVYEKDHFDMWGFYKNDYDETLKEETNENLARRTSAQSASDVDAWSLTSITSPSGATVSIAYESDVYDDVVLNSQQIFSVKNATDAGQNLIKIQLWDEGLNLHNYYSQNDVIDLDLQVAYETIVANCTRGVCQNCEDVDSLVRQEDVNGLLFEEYEDTDKGYHLKTISANNPVIKQVNDDEKYLVIEDAALYELLTSKKIYKIHKLSEGPYSFGEYRLCWNRNAIDWPDYISAGVCSAPYQEKYGGGLRVNSISVSTENEGESTTYYEYENGTTSYEPFVIPSPLINPAYDPEDKRATRLNFKKSVLKRYQNIIQTSRELPGPGIMYKTVTVREKWKDENGSIQKVPFYSTYAFQVFQDGMVSFDVDPVVVRDEHGSDKGLEYTRTMTRKVRLKDFSSRVGELISITLHDEGGSIVSKTTNHYLHDEVEYEESEDFMDNYEPLLKEKFNNQGLVEETFSSARLVLYKKKDRIPYGESKGDFVKEKQYHLLGIINKRETYPNILTGQTTINYKTGMKSESKNLAFDYYSGAAIKTLSFDSYGNYYVDESIAAYKKYPSMGSKVYSSQNKNMLTQIAGTFSYKVAKDDYNTKLGLVNASVQTWSDKIEVLRESSQTGIWRKHSSWFWDGREPLNADGTSRVVEFQSNPFDFTNIETNALWEKGSELTLYDVYSHALEAHDLNKNYASTRMDPYQQQVIASATNAKYEETAFSGAEFYSNSTLEEGGVGLGDGIPTRARSHTGKVSLQVAPNKSAFIRTLNKIDHPFIDFDGEYKANVWVYIAGDGETPEQIPGVQLYCKIDGQIQEVHPSVGANKSKNWYRLELVANLKGANEVEFGCRNLTQRPVYFDDFRVAPLKGTMVAYVYDPESGELNYIIDEDNFYTKFEYDPLGRLIRTSRELLNFDFDDGKTSYRADKVINEIVYNYGSSVQK